jgi:polyketide synthase PksL
MADFIEYVVSELKSKRLSKQNALSILKQFYSGSAGNRGPAQLHPLLHENTSDLGQQSYRTRLSGEEFYLADHQVRFGSGKIEKVLPAVAYLEMARAGIERARGGLVSGEVLELRETVWARPVVVGSSVELSSSAEVDPSVKVSSSVDPGSRVEPGSGVELSLALSEDEAGGIEYEIYSAGESDAEDVVHCQGRAVFGPQVVQTESALDVSGVRARCTRGRVSSNELYDRLERLGVIYGPGHRAVEWLERGEGEVLAQLVLPESVERGWEEYGLHPSLLDGALQVCGALLGEDSPEGRAVLPYALEQLRVVRACARRMWAWARVAQAGSGIRADTAANGGAGALNGTNARTSAAARSEVRGRLRKCACSCGGSRLVSSVESGLQQRSSRRQARQNGRAGNARD